MAIDVWSSMPHYGAHLDPIWHALPEAVKGNRYGPLDDPPGGQTLMVGAYRDLEWVGFRRYHQTVLVEHGVGQSYADQPDHPAYCGGERTRYDLHITPGLHLIDPSARRRVAVGCPKLDPWLSGDRGGVARHVVLSFHWDCGVSPEAGTAFWDYLPHLLRLAEQIGNLFIHAHPRIQDDVREQVERIGLTFIPDFEWVLDSGSVYCCDNSSTIFEFAATDRPVVLLQAAGYRRSVNHGRRFYDWTDIGPTAWHPTELPAALGAVGCYEQSRRDRVRHVYARLDGGSAAQAADAVLQLHG